MNRAGLCAITGANGFLGREIISQFKAAGIPLCGTDIQPTCLEKGIQYQQADITNLDQLPRALQGASVVIHAAGMAHIFSPEKDLDWKFSQVNEMGTANVVSAAAEIGAEHVILISSVSVYGHITQGMCGEDSICSPRGSYALSKRNAELKAQGIAFDRGVPLTILRLATLFGEEDPGNIGRLLRALDKGLFIWIGGGHNRKSLLYKGDAARACLAVASRPASDIRIYNVSGPPTTMWDIVNGLSKALSKRPLPIRIPKHTALVVSRILPRLSSKALPQLRLTLEKWLAEDVYDTSRFERDYGYRVQVDVNEGLNREVRWYLKAKRD